MKKSKKGYVPAIVPERYRKEEFIEALADFLGNGLAAKSIYLSMTKSPAHPIHLEWAKLRQILPLSGWADRDECLVAIRKILE